MLKINLLPWRETLRKQQQQDYILAIAAGAMITCIILLLLYLQIKSMQQYQQKRNNLIKAQISSLAKDVTEIDSIKAKKTDVLTRIKAIQALQESRSNVVYLFEKLAKTISDGIVLTSFKQNGENLEFKGKAKSHAYFSVYMSIMENSTWLKSIVLKVIEHKKTTDKEAEDFYLYAKLAVINLQNKKLNNEAIRNKLEL